MSDVIAAVLERDPDWDALALATPRPVARLVQRCLEKDAQRRLRDIGDARLEIDDALAGGLDEGNARAQPGAVTRRTAIAALAGAAAGAAATAGFGVSRYRNDRTPRSFTRFAVPWRMDRRSTPVSTSSSRSRRTADTSPAMSCDRVSRSYSFDR